MHIILRQIVAFNAPVCFNVGFEQSVVDDTTVSILDWNTQDGMIFCGGSGSGITVDHPAIREFYSAPATHRADRRQQR